MGFLRKVGKKIGRGIRKIGRALKKGFGLNYRKLANFFNYSVLGTKYAFQTWK